MTTRSRNYPNLYKDSVSLMTVSAKVMAVAGIDMASVVMASATNVANLAEAGLGDVRGPSQRPRRRGVGRRSGVRRSARESRRIAIRESRGAAMMKRPGRNKSVTSIQMAVAKDPTHNFALISVPGDYAAAEAMKALRLGMDVMLFSDNVPPESELALKTVCARA